MKFTKINGKKVGLPKAHQYLIDWESKTRSKFQDKAKQFLRKTWSSDVVFEELPIVGTKMTIDIYNASKKIAVEVQGRQHIQFVKHFHKNLQGYQNQLKRDAQKLKFCEINDIKLIEIYDESELTAQFFEDFGIYLID